MNIYLFKILISLIFYYKQQFSFAYPADETCLKEYNIFIESQNKDINKTDSMN